MMRILPAVRTALSSVGTTWTCAIWSRARVTWVGKNDARQWCELESMPPATLAQIVKSDVVTYLFGVLGDGTIIPATASGVCRGRARCKLQGRVDPRTSSEPGRRSGVRRGAWRRIAIAGTWNSVTVAVVPRRWNPAFYAQPPVAESPSPTAPKWTSRPSSRTQPGCRRQRSTDRPGAQLLRSTEHLQNSGHARNGAFFPTWMPDCARSCPQRRRSAPQAEWYVGPDQADGKSNVGHATARTGSSVHRGRAPTARR